MTTVPGLHQPKRAIVAGVEVLAVVALAFAVVWCWHRGVLRSGYPVADRVPLESTRYLGNWIGAAIGLATLGGVLLLDAARQVLLAVRAGGGAGGRASGRQEDATPDV